MDLVRAKNKDFEQRNKDNEDIAKLKKEIRDEKFKPVKSKIEELAGKVNVFVHPKPSKKKKDDFLNLDFGFKI